MLPRKNSYFCDLLAGKGQATFGRKGNTGYINLVNCRQVTFVVSEQADVVPEHCVHVTEGCLRGPAALQTLTAT